MVQKSNKKCSNKGFKHDGKCYRYKAEVFYPNGKKKMIFTNKLKETLK